MRRLKKKDGFTLLEMMACIVTLIMIALICAAGLNMSVKSYNESLFSSNSQMLESMLHTSIGDVLRYADTVTVGTSGEVTSFHNANFDIANAQLTLDGKGYLTLTNGASQTLLVGSKVYADGLYMDGFSLSYDENKKIFTGSYTIKSTVVSQTRQVSFAFKSILESM